MQLHAATKWRFCLDYRALNILTRSMGWPIPNIKHMLQRIGSKTPKFYGVLDLTAGYHQALISKNSRNFTAFRTLEGLYRWKRLPMGLKGAPSYFQHQMSTQVLGDLMYDICEVYLDDIIVFADNEEDFLNNLDKIFNRLKQYNITVNPEKVRLGMTEVEYVGHTISENGLSFSTQKRENVLNFRKPETQKQMRSFLGLTSQFRDHVAHYDRLAKSLQDLYHHYVPHKKIKWTDELDQAFIDIQHAVYTCPKMFFIDEQSPIFLQTDASLYGIGAYLFQIVDNQKQPITFISKTFINTKIK